MKRKSVAQLGVFALENGLLRKEGQYSSKLET